MPEKKEQQNETTTRTATIESTVLSSADGKHRYLLSRSWDERLPRLAVVMIRPGYSGLVTEDTSTTLVLGQSVGLGFGCVTIVNIFSRLGMDDKDLAGEGSSDKENDRAILRAAAAADKVVIATGRKNSSAIEARRAEVLELLRPHAGKLFEIADKAGNAGFHPLSPRVRYGWTLVPLVLKTTDSASAGSKLGKGAKPKEKPPSDHP